MTLRASTLLCVLTLLAGWPADRAEAQTRERLDIAIAGGTTSARNWHGDRDPLEHRTGMALVRFHLNGVFAVEAAVGTVHRGFEGLWEMPPTGPDASVARDVEPVSLTSKQIEGSVLVRAAFPRSVYGVRPLAVWGFAGSRERACEARGVVSAQEKGGFGPVLCEVYRDGHSDATRIGGLGLEVRALGWVATLEARRSVSLFPSEFFERRASDRTESVIVSVGRSF
jgi:hypothetical protein